jgi:hypothetical protein
VGQCNGIQRGLMLAVYSHDTGFGFPSQALLLSNELKLNELLCVDFLIIAAEEVGSCLLTTQQCKSCIGRCRYLWLHACFVPSSAEGPVQCRGSSWCVL